MLAAAVALCRLRQWTPTANMVRRIAEPYSPVAGLYPKTRIRFIQALQY